LEKCEADQYNEAPQKGFAVCLKSISLEWRLKFIFANWILKFYLEWRFGTRVICKVTPLFHPLSPLFSWQIPSPLWMVSAKEGNFIKSQYKMLKLRIWCTRFESNLINEEYEQQWKPCQNKIQQVLWIDTRFH
jgi:hypothetical protein